MRIGKHVWVKVSLCVLVAVLAAHAVAAESDPTEKQLFRKGLKLWTHYCAYCHNARPAGEFNRLEWDTLMLHMRVRANLPAQDAEAIRLYLRAH